MLRGISFCSTWHIILYEYTTHVCIFSIFHYLLSLLLLKTWHIRGHRVVSGHKNWATTKDGEQLGQRIEDNRWASLGLSTGIIRKQETFRRVRLSLGEKRGREEEETISHRAHTARWGRYQQPSYVSAGLILNSLMRTVLLTAYYIWGNWDAGS